MCDSTTECTPSERFPKICVTHHGFPSLGLFDTTPSGCTPSERLPEMVEEFPRPSTLESHCDPGRAQIAMQRPPPQDRASTGSTGSTGSPGPAVPPLARELWEKIALSCATDELTSLVGVCKETKEAVYDAMTSSEPPSVVCDEDGKSMFCNREQVEAFVKVALLGRSTFLTGGAGSGKSFVTRKIVESVVSRAKSSKVLVVAPTGAAARVASTPAKTAQTIHFAFNISNMPRLETDPPYRLSTTSYGAGLTVEGADEAGERQLDDPDEPTEDGRTPLPTARLCPDVRYQLANLKLLVIDEVSMVSNEIFTLMDLSLKYVRESSLPFGGVTVLCVGDFCQLPPVLSSAESSARNMRMGGPWAFQSKSWTLESMALRQIVRQKDPTFASVLNRVRVGRASWSDASWLNRHKNRPSPPKLSIFPSNPMCDERNAAEMRKLVEGGEEEVTFESTQYLQKLISTDPWRVAPVPLPYNGIPRITYPEAKSVTLCVGARVRAIKNIYERNNEEGGDGKMRLQVANGQRGTVLEIDDTYGTISWSVTVRWDPLRPGDEPEETTVFMSRRSKRQRFKLDGHFVYAVSAFLPLSLAWAITVHSAQGASVDMPVDINHKVRTLVKDNWIPQVGGAYVALSRATDIANVNMLQRFHPNDAVMDPDVKRFMAANGLM